MIRLLGAAALGWYANYLKDVLVDRHRQMKRKRRMAA